MANGWISSGNRKFIQRLEQDVSLNLLSSMPTPDIKLEKMADTKRKIFYDSKVLYIFYIIFE